MKVVNGFEKFQVDRGIHELGFMLEPFGCKLAVFVVKLNADAIPAALHCGKHRGPGPAKRIKNRVAPEREHPDEAVGQFYREGGRVNFR